MRHQWFSDGMARSLPAPWLAALLCLSLLLLLGSAMSAPSATPLRVLPHQAAGNTEYGLTLNVTTDAPVGPVPGANISLNGTYKGTTPMDGILYLGPLPSGTYDLRVQAARYQPVDLNITLTTTEVVPVHLVSSGTPGVLEGTYAPANASFSVAPYPPVRPTSENATSAQFELLLPPGTYNYTLRYHGEVQRGEFLVEPGRTLTVNLALPSGPAPSPPASPWTDPYVETGLVVLGVGVGAATVLAVTWLRRRKAPP
jgi:hypothetical protein